MTKPLIMLQSMPTPEDFYRLYWNRQPFAVQGAIPKATMDTLISADELASLAMEEGPQSRMVVTAGSPQDWTCRFGPFDEDDFTNAGDADWSLLVQNVEQFHPETARLLPHFNFAPRWMMDDIMVSFSATGGSVGAHLDSYHVFLVQGQGMRRWTVSHKPTPDAAFIEGMELKILKQPIDGATIEVQCGDVLYIPPGYGHEGTTLEPALTFSIGFLGPKVSELFSSYAQYLSQREDSDSRYVGQDLSPVSAGFSISQEAFTQLRSTLASHLNAKDFAQWLVAQFTESAHEELANFGVRDTCLTKDAFRQQLKAGAGLIKPLYVKCAMTHAASGEPLLGIDGETFVLDAHQALLVGKLLSEKIIDINNTPELLENAVSVDFLLTLYNHQALEFADPA